MLPTNELFNKYLQAKTLMRNLSLEHWVKYEVWKWNWWLSVALTFVPLYIWWIIADKKRLMEIVTYGFFINISASFLDVVGSEFVLWDYPVRVIPNLPRLVPIDFTVIPVVYMLIYQYFPKWKGFLIASTGVAAIFSFIAEPLMVWMKLYMLITWKYYYSFPIYIAMAVVGKVMVNLFKAAQKKALDNGEN
jgi:hypothetical protein